MDRETRVKIINALKTRPALWERRGRKAKDWFAVETSLEEAGLKVSIDGLKMAWTQIRPHFIRYVSPDRSEHKDLDYEMMIHHILKLMTGAINVVFVLPTNSSIAKETPVPSCSPGSNDSSNLPSTLPPYSGVPEVDSVSQDGLRPKNNCADPRETIETNSGPDDGDLFKSFTPRPHIVLTPSDPEPLLKKRKTANTAPEIRPKATVSIAVQTETSRPPDSRVPLSAQLLVALKVTFYTDNETQSTRKVSLKEECFARKETNFGIRDLTLYDAVAETPNISFFEPLLVPHYGNPTSSVGPYFPTLPLQTPNMVTYDHAQLMTSLQMMMAAPYDPVHQSTMYTPFANATIYDPFATQQSPLPDHSKKTRF